MLTREELAIIRPMLAIGPPLIANLCDQAEAAIDLHAALEYIRRWWDECGFGDDWHPSIQQKVRAALARCEATPHAAADKPRTNQP
jgi:hypothetical protein